MKQVQVTINYPTQISYLCAATISTFLITTTLITTPAYATVSTVCTGGTTAFCTSKAIDANTPNFADRQTIVFTGNTVLTVSSPDAFNNTSGNYQFRDNTRVIITAEMGMNGGTYNMNAGANPVPGSRSIFDIDASKGLNNARLLTQATNPAIINANRKQAINGGSQVFNAGSTLNINAEEGVFGSTSLTLNNATLNLNSSKAFTENSLAGNRAASLRNNSVLNINAEDAMTGGQINIQDSEVNIKDKGSISGGILVITGTSTLNANVSNSITGEIDKSSRQLFQEGTQMNVNAFNALNGGNQTFNDATLNVNAEKGISGGYQILARNSVLNANAEESITDGLMKFENNATLNALKKNTITGGTQNFFDNSVVNANGGNTLAGGTQNFNDNSLFNANSEGSITGQSRQTFGGNSILKVNTANAINGGNPTLKDNAQLNVDASQGISGGNFLFDGNSILNLNAENSLTGGAFRFKGQSIANVNHENALVNLNSGALVFTESSKLNVMVNNGISGLIDNSNRQIFQQGTEMNVNVSGGVTGGNQIFNSAKLNINARQGITGGYQILAGDSVLNTTDDQAITDGLMKFEGNAILNATKNQTISGGTQNFFDNSRIEATGGNTLTGGSQNFNDNSVLNANSAGTITSDSRQVFAGNSTLNLNVANALNGGNSTILKDNAQLNINAEEAVTGGNLLFDGNSTLTINASNAITNAAVRFKGNSRINTRTRRSLLNTTIRLEGNSSLIIDSEDALDHTDNVEFVNTFDTTTGSMLDLNGYSLTLGRLTSNGDKAKIINSGENNAVLTTGLYDYQLAAGQSYTYNNFIRAGIMREDAVVSSALADIARDGGFALLPQFSDRIIPQVNSIIQNNQNIWLQTTWRQQNNQGNGLTQAAWKGHTQNILIGSDLFPATDSNQNKFGFYAGYLSGKSNITGNKFNSPNAVVGQYRFNTYGAGIYWRYLTTKGWYANTTIQINRYRGQAKATNSFTRPNVTGYSGLVALEMGYPLALSESLTLLPRLQLAYQDLKMGNYQFDDLQITNTPDKQLSAIIGARAYWENMTISGTRWLPYLDVQVSDKFAARDKNQVTIISRDYSQSLLTSFDQVAVKLTGGVTVRLNDYVNYYAQVAYQNASNDRSNNSWEGALGLNVNW